MAKTAIAPMDRTKIYFQTHQKTFTFNGALDYLILSYKKRGFTSLWRGNSASMARVVPYAAIQYSSHEQFKHLLKVETNLQKKAHPHRSFIAGSLAGVVSTSCTYPLDVARARMAVDSSYKSLTEVFTQSIQRYGIKNLYRGFIPTVCGVIPYAGCSFFTYETLKRIHFDFYGDKEINPVFRLIFGAMAGLFGQSASYPLDIVRRRMQTQNGYVELGIVGTIKKVVNEEGLVHGLYKGLSLNWVKGPIAVGISFTSFDLFNKFFLSLCTLD
ncbi:hypothetical protein SSS_02232 [Sarcoptes scabiei]|uniref:Mitochondrial coenzyme A transporter SLC25A42 n=1 Tax=Sarcoptes scabiei TaxID=52283 RepID=A0A834VH29_SARSC|nr:hypothetical protein SSS_02232 [Sarcoptes scabiei]